MLVVSKAAVAKALGAGLIATAAAVGSLAALHSPGGGFVYGTDSGKMTVAGDGPYQEPVVGGPYNGYMGMAGNWARSEGCTTGDFLAWSPANAGQANSNYVRYHTGVGTGVYWYMGGPGVDPHWNGTTTEAYSWGEQQAAWTLAFVFSRYIPYPVIWADIEMPEVAPAPDNGWNDVYSTPCSGHVVQSYIPAAVDRAEFNGFAAYITSHSAYHVGVYSAPQIWTAIFGTGVDSLIPNTYEWTYWEATSSLSQAPTGWCLRGKGGCARFFGGQTYSDKYALMWQWSGGGGVVNGHGDFDQIDDARMG